MPIPIRKPGHVYLIGAGPGDPGLITVKGRDCIQKADVILYDYLANDQLLKYARTGAEIIYSGKIGGQHNREQSQINDLLVEKALQGHTVARLKGGDPFIFGRGGEECEALLEAGVPFEIVPGITAGIGAATYAGIPLTHRDVTTSVAFVTGHERPDRDGSAIDWQRLSLGSGTIVFYMGMKNLGEIARNLIQHGRPATTPVAIVRWGTRPEQTVLEGTLADIAEMARRKGFGAPAVTIVGEVVRLRSKLRWFDNRPLSGKGILVTRAADQAGDFSRMLHNAGAAVYECPTIAILPPEDFTAVDDAVEKLASFDWTVFSSANAVQHFFARITDAGKDARAFGGCRVCTVGPKTAAALAEYGIRADLMPSDYKGEGVAEAFASIDLNGKKVLFPKGNKAREVIPEALDKLGAKVVAPVTYRNVLPDEVPQEALDALADNRVDCITFTASSTVINLAKLLGENRMRRLLENVTVAAIGPITSRTCRELGLEVGIEPAEYTLEALTKAITAHFAAAYKTGD